VPAGFKNFFAEVGIPIDNEENFSPPPIDGFVSFAENDVLLAKKGV
jgi:hypothetical protein